MNILVFGKDGQLGKAFQALLDSQLATVADKPTIEYVGRSECDLSNGASLDSLLKQFAPDLIINASAYTAVDKAEVEIDLAFAINAKAPEIMAQYAAGHGTTFLHYSTDYVFDGEKYGFYLEDDLRNPLGIYGKSKAAGEEAIAKAFLSSKSAGQYAIFRTSWVYGDGGNFIRTILRLSKDREELKIINDQFGVPTSAQWLAQVSLDLAMDENFKPRQFPSGIYHAVPAGETTWYGLACLAVQSAISAGITLKAGPEAINPILAVEYPLPAPRPMNSRMSTDKLRVALTQRSSNHSNSYNEVGGILAFPTWEGMVREYVSRLARDQLI
jgi:dTDP-4-dehydrorhamnose reductase